MKILTTTILLLFCAMGIYAQNGLEGIIVEKYYVSNANDASMDAIGGTLPVGSTTYRIYADLLPGYKFQAAFGIASHELRLATTTFFFNNEDRGAISPTYTKSFAADNTIMLDSWLSVGAACVGNYGILKSEDNGIATVVNNDGLLQNNDPSAGIPLTVQDGLISGTPELFTKVGIDAEIAVFGAVNNVGNVFSTYNGSWAALNGATGPTAANKVLIAQMTTNGVFSFKLNLQIGTPSGGVQQFVAENPTGNQVQLPGLIYTSQTDFNVNIKTFIEGYYTGSGTMNAAINPVLHPTLCDSLTLSLASSVSPYTILYSTKAVMNTNGTVQYNIPNSFNGNSYYLVLNHRNALETWSASPILLSPGVSYDFSNAQTKAYGSNLVSFGDGKFGMYSGDISDSNLGLGVQDDIIEATDYTDMENAVSVILVGYIPQDITGDGVVESTDYTFMENNVSKIVFCHRP